MRRAFDDAVHQQVDALMMSEGGMFRSNSQLITDLAHEHRLPTIYQSREFVLAGGLISYGPDYPQFYFRAASFFDKIARGMKPGDIPIEQPTAVSLSINLRAARAVGVTVPVVLLARADELIE